MVFPATPRVLLGEIQVGGTDWANITDDIFSNRSAISMTRGQPSEASQSAPATCSLMLKNTAGRYSPSNPLSPFYSLIGRNTPLRISYGRGAYGLVLAAQSNGRSETIADSAALSITGDTDIRVDMELLSVDNGNLWGLGDFDIASKFSNSDPARSWTFTQRAGKLRFNWFTLGTAASVKQAESTVAVPAGSGRKAVRATIDVNNGAAGNTVTFYTAPDMTGPWTQLGAPVVQAGTTSIFDGTAVLRVGANPDASTWTVNQAAACTVYSAELRNGIGGTLVANPTYSARPLDTNPHTIELFSDAQGNWWFPSGTSDAARIWYGDVDIRFHGEISSLPPSWDASEKDPTVTIEAAGLLRRLGQGTDPAQTGLKDWVVSDKTALAAYYPLDGGEKTTYSLSLGGSYYLTNRFWPQSARYPAGAGIVSPVYQYGVDMGPLLGTGLLLNATGISNFVGDVGTPDPNAALDFIWNSAALGVCTVQIQDYNNNHYQLILNTDVNGYTAELKFYNWNTGITSLLTTTGVIAAIADEDQQPHHCRIQLTTSGANTNWALYFDGVSAATGTVSGATLNGVSVTRVFYSRYINQTYMNLAHWTVWANTSAAAIPTAAEFWQAATAYAGEMAGERIQRICDVGGIDVEFIGDPYETAIMGPQYSEGKLTQLRDAEGTDLGILTEPRHQFGLQYRTLRSMVGQDVVVTLDHNAGHIAPPFEPTYDDQLTRNDVTVVRREGGTYRFTQEAGKLSALDPPNGVGRYRDEITVNALTDDQLPGFAAWFVAQGTIDGPRFPFVNIDLHSPGIQATPGLEAACLAVQEGDLVAVSNLSALGIYETIYLLVIGVTEVVSDGGFKHTLRWNCQPGSLYLATVYSAAVGGVDRYDTGGSSLAAAATSSATSLSVATAAGNRPWTTTAGEFPFDVNIAGEQVRVTNITGAASPQTFTVTRAINGVAKAQVSGAPVRLWKTPRYSL